ncbi:hypothetical protein EXIGLDRAFT_708060 [Exidia glandulosa HHB12029]|uniref:Uncharacterized protein n=1 Tax=Exidia glandulosa HHB12029 TaxID=1314781 RepID=A0A165JIU9_EXIGL|nr:hypothetical protein EXIGLDRAFT_708060 [Exidia glandulosa HHB12029]
MSQSNTPQPGEIWVARASALLGALRAADLYSAAPPSIVMQAKKDRLEMGQDVPDARPCIVLKADKQNTIRLIPTTTLQGQPLHLVNGHLRHFVVPFGEHDGDDETSIRPTTTWLKSTMMPTYICAYPLDVKRIDVTSRYSYDGSIFALDGDELLKLQQICNAKLNEYKLKPKREMQQYHDSYDEDKRRRHERWAAGPASAPPEPLSASRAADATPAFSRGVGVSQLQRLPLTAPRRLNSVVESGPLSANASPPMALDLSIDDDDADRTDEWPSLGEAYSADGSPTEGLRAKGRARSASGLLESKDATSGQRNAWANPLAIGKVLSVEERASLRVAGSVQTADAPVPPTDAASRERLHSTGAKFTAPCMQHAMAPVWDHPPSPLSHQMAPPISVARPLIAGKHDAWTVQLHADFQTTFKIQKRVKEASFAQAMLRLALEEAETINIDRSQGKEERKVARRQMRDQFESEVQESPSDTEFQTPEGMS